MAIGGAFVDAMEVQALDSAIGPKQRRTMFAFTSVRTAPSRSLAERAHSEVKWVMKVFTQVLVAGMGVTRRKASRSRGRRRRIVPPETRGTRQQELTWVCDETQRLLHAIRRSTYTLHVCHHPQKDMCQSVSYAGAFQR